MDGDEALGAGGFGGGPFGGRHGGGHHGGGHHGGGHGGGRGGRAWRGGGVPGGRKLSAAELQLLILRLLEDGPAHGYELIRRLEQLSQGFYAPSPGVIYPALTYLDEIGEAEAEADGKRKLYRLTQAGTARLDAARAEAEVLLAALVSMGERMDRVREAWATPGDEAGPGAGPGAGIDPALAEERHRAHMALKAALHTRMGCTPQEMRRIITILNRAAAEILAGDSSAPQE